MSKEYALETERLIIRSTQLDDADIILANLNTPKFLQFVGDRKVRTLEAAEKYIEERILPQQKRLGYSNFIIIRKEDKAKLGVVGLYDREGLEGLDIGFGLLPENEGKGYAYEAANCLMNWAKKEMNIKKIKGITVEENLASRKLLEKLGLMFIKKFYLKGDPDELMLFEWKANEG